MPQMVGGARAAEAYGIAYMKALVNVGYNQPTEIQKLGIPAALAGSDVLGTAHTGTGKTAAFTLPMIQRLAAGGQHDYPRGLVITPTRELAQQIELLRCGAGQLPLHLSDLRLLRLVQAGHRIAFVPQGSEPRISPRVDPITAPAAAVVLAVISPPTTISATISISYGSTGP